MSRLGSLPATNSVSLEGRDGWSGAAPRAGKSGRLESWPPDGNWELGLAAARRKGWETWLRCVRATWRRREREDCVCDVVFGLGNPRLRELCLDC